MIALGQPRELDRQGRSVCIAIGVFDGVHRGHQAVIGQMVDAARQSGSVAVTVTFDRHPNEIVAPEQAPFLIQSLAEKLRVIATQGVDATWVIRFDRAFSLNSGEAFSRSLARDFHPLSSIFVGDRFHFGHRRSGDVTLLARIGRELGFALHPVAAVRERDIVVSSTRLRNAITEGDLELASALLDRPYELAGKIVRGDRLGRRLGFPTANLELKGILRPPTGVYVAVARGAGLEALAVVNIGHRPTVAEADSEARVEAHLLDWSGDLYGTELRLGFIRKLREELKFGSAEDLRKQIGKDIQEACTHAGLKA